MTEDDRKNVKVTPGLFAELTALKLLPGETYNDVIQRAVNAARTTLESQKRRIPPGAVVAG